MGFHSAQDVELERTKPIHSDRELERVGRGHEQRRSDLNGDGNCLLCAVFLFHSLEAWRAGGYDGGVLLPAVTYV